MTVVDANAETVQAVYDRFATVYDLIYGLALQPGRKRGMELLAPRPGEHILEVGVGTGVNLSRYPDGCRVVAVDPVGSHVGTRAPAGRPVAGPECPTVSDGRRSPWAWRRPV